VGVEGASERQPLRVVIVDDEPDVLLLLEVQLRGHPDVEVVGTATDGGEGVERCRDLRPDAVVMDLLMPQMNGFEAIEALERELPDIAVVAHSAVAGDFVRSEMDRLHVRLVLKSGDPAPLVAALKAAAGR
jgi:two-component system, NarL family, nitrate/nitrite response regulator NarL